jgi:hypothetical protein
VWSGLLAELPINVRSKWRGGAWSGAPAGSLQFEVPNEWHKKACDDGRLEVEKVLKSHFGLAVPVEVVVTGQSGGGAPSTPAGPSRSDSPPIPNEPADDDDLESINVAELADAGDVATGGVELLMREFGGELVEEDPR